MSKKSITTSSKDRGFTLVELMLAMALFSFILMFALSGFVHINRSYNKGLTVKRVHDASRIIMDQLTRSIVSSTGDLEFSYSPATSTNPSDAYALCIPGEYKFRWFEGYVYQSIDTNDLDNYSFASGPYDGNCNEIPSTLGSTNQKFSDMISLLVAVQDIRIEEINNGTFSIEINLTSNNSNNDFSQPKSCPDLSDPYCDFVTLRTVVTQRR